MTTQAAAADTAHADATPSEWQMVITGCGTSHGNPVFGLPDRWSTDPRDQRRRTAAILRRGTESILIDCGPDLLAQLRDPYCTWDGMQYPQYAVTSTLGVLMTHEHADHSHGINDLRLLNRLQKKPVPVHADQEHLDLLMRQFEYCFAGDDTGAWRPGLVGHAFRVGDRLTIDGWPIQTVPLQHGPAGPVTGFRFGDLAYLTDVKTVLTGAWQHLEDLDTLVLGVLREEPHATHLSVSEALEVVQRLRPRRTVFTHLGLEVRYADLAAKLPVGIEPAFDGLTLPVANWQQEDSAACGC